LNDDIEKAMRNCIDAHTEQIIMLRKLVADYSAAILQIGKDMQDVQKDIAKIKYNSSLLKSYAERTNLKVLRIQNKFKKKRDKK